MALASLTATYTDSEGEDDDVETKMDVVLPQEQEEKDENQTQNQSSAEASRTNSPLPQVKIMSNYRTLVSYQDDTIVSDDEEAHGNNKIIIVDENNEEITEEKEEEIEEDGITLPPEPIGVCSPELQEKITRLHQKMMNNDMDMNAIIQQRKDFRNPSIYEKLIQFCGINELGTNYPPSIYDPLKWSKESYYEELANVQKIEMEKREKERKSKVEVVSGTKKLELDDSSSAANVAASAAAAANKKRKSKWDQPGGNNLTAIKPAGLVQPSLTTNTTGTKATVIPAFGSLNTKKR